MKKIIAALLAAVMVLSFAACTNSKKTTTTTKAAQTDSEYIKAKGTLVIGITDYAPMDYKDKDGSWTGFDAEFAEAVAKKLGVKVKFIEIDWDNKFFELNSKSIDCVWNGMTITDEVKKNTSCTNAYAKNEQVVVMAADKASKYKDVSSLKGLTFAVETGSAGESAAKDNSLKYTSVQNQTTALLEVKSGSEDACIIDSTMADTMTGEGTSYANLTSCVSLTKEEYGIGFRKNSDMTAIVNQYITELTKDGTLKKLSEKYSIALAD